MKTLSISTRISILTLVAGLAITSVAIARAEENSTVDADASVNTTVQTTPPTKRPPIGAQIKANMENRIEKNREIRNMDINRRASSTPPFPPGKMGDDDRPRIMNASTTIGVMFKKNAENRKEMVKKMETRVFEIRKKALVQELTVALKNLDSIATRIESRLNVAEDVNKDMTASRALFVTAQASLAKAKVDLATFAALNAPSTPSTPTATTTEVDVARPRVLGDTAIKSVKDARDALKKVVESIAKALGVKVGAEATSTEH